MRHIHINIKCKSLQSIPGMNRLTLFKRVLNSLSSELGNIIKNSAYFVCLIQDIKNELSVAIIKNASSFNIQFFLFEKVALKIENAQKTRNESQVLNLIERLNSIFLSLMILAKEISTLLSNLILSYLDVEGGAIVSSDSELIAFSSKFFDLVEGLKSCMAIEEIKELLLIEFFEFDNKFIELSVESTEALKLYIRVASLTDFNEPITSNILNTITGLTRKYFRSREFIKPVRANHYVAIVAPSFYGKTQFAFILAVKTPVIYVNFSQSSRRQYIYDAFHVISSFFYSGLTEDLKLFKDEINDIESEKLLSEKYYSIPLKTIGFISKLLELSIAFPFASKDWMEFYLGSPSMIFEKKSVKEIHEQIGKIFFHFKNIMKFIIFFPF